MPTSADHLLPQESDVHNKLYDPEALLNISGTVARGYIVLLSGGSPGTGGSTTSSSSDSPSSTSNNKKNKKKSSSSSASPNNNEDVSLAFMALTSGNVLDACFGANSSPSSSRQQTPANRAAANAKSLLGDCDDHHHDDTDNETFRRAAVHAYCDAFKVVVVHDDKMKKLNCFTRCFRSKKIRTESQKNLKEAFEHLAQIINEQHQPQQQRQH